MKRVLDRKKKITTSRETVQTGPKFPLDQTTHIQRFVTDTVIKSLEFL